MLLYSYGGGGDIIFSILLILLYDGGNLGVVVITLLFDLYGGGGGEIDFTFSTILSLGGLFFLELFFIVSYEDCMRGVEIADGIIIALGRTRGCLTELGRTRGCLTELVRTRGCLTELVTRFFTLEYLFFFVFANKLNSRLRRYCNI